MEVLFVCTHNAGRSQMAEAYFNRIAAERGLPLHASSAGTIGGRQLNPNAELAMEEAGISIESHRPKLLTPEMVKEADLIITMGCGVDAASCPARFLAGEDWGLDDPSGRSIEEVRRIRDEIRERVERFLDHLKL